MLTITTPSRLTVSPAALLLSDACFVLWARRHEVLNEKLAMPSSKNRLRPCGLAALDLLRFNRKVETLKQAPHMTQFNICKFSQRKGSSRVLSKYCFVDYHLKRTVITAVNCVAMCFNQFQDSIHRSYWFRCFDNRHILMKGLYTSWTSDQVKTLGPLGFPPTTAPLLTQIPVSSSSLSKSSSKQHEIHNLPSTGQGFESLPNERWSFNSGGHEKWRQNGLPKQKIGGGDCTEMIGENKRMMRCSDCL